MLSTQQTELLDAHIGELEHAHKIIEANLFKLNCGESLVDDMSISEQREQVLMSSARMLDKIVAFNALREYAVDDNKLSIEHEHVNIVNTHLRELNSVFVHLDKLASDFEANKIGQHANPLIVKSMVTDLRGRARVLESVVEICESILVTIK